MKHKIRSVLKDVLGLRKTDIDYVLPGSSSVNRVILDSMLVKKEVVISILERILRDYSDNPNELYAALVCLFLMMHATEYRKAEKEQRNLPKA